MSSVKVYKPQGGDNLIVGAGGTLTVQANGTFCVEAGAIICEDTAWITTDMIEDHAVTFVKADAFISGLETGTGAPQNIAHGLGVAPTAVLISPYNNVNTVGLFSAQFSIVEGVHTMTNLIVTATEGLIYKCFAWA